MPYVIDSMPQHDHPFDSETEGEAGMDLGLSQDPEESFRIFQGRIQKVYDKLAEDGYLAIAPDLFWRLEPGVELDPDSAAVAAPPVS